MDFWNFFKGFLGLPKRNEVPNNFQDERSPYLRDDDNVRRSYPNEEEAVFGFNIFSNPLEMHRYFEKQMNDMFKAFGFEGENSPFQGSGGSSFFDFGGFQGDQNDGAFGSTQVPDGNLRDHYLKPGYKQYSDSNKDKTDTDVDGKLDVNDLDTVFSNKNLQPAPHRGQPQFHLFGQSITSRTVKNADGSIETHRTVRDHEGNEETTTTRKQGDKEYTIVTKTTKDGKKEIVENFINCDEKPLGTVEGPDGMKHPNWFPFDRYFK